MGQCAAETYQILLLLVALCTSITVVVCLFTLFREDKDEQITPLCPQMVVSQPELTFMLALPDRETTVLPILELDMKPLCRAVIDYPDATRLGAGGVSATIRLQDSN